MKPHPIPLPPGVRYDVQQGWLDRGKPVGVGWVRARQEWHYDERLVAVLRARALSLRPPE